MAYYFDDQEEQNQAPQGEGPATLGPQGTATLGDQSTQPGGNSGGVNKPAQTPDRGSNFVGIQDYLKANQPQAEKLGDQASGVIQKSADEARQSVQGLQSQFDQDTQNAAVQNNEDLLARANEAEKLSQEERETLKKQYNANYSGPQNLQGYDAYGDALKKTQTAQSNVKNADTEEGRQQIITQINDKPRNAGITGFDSVLLQAGGGREKVNQAAQANKDVTQDLIGTADLNAQQKASDLKSQNDATRQATQAALGGAQESFSKDLMDRVKAWQDNAVNQTNRLTQDVSDLNLFDDTLAAYGLNEGDTTYGLDLGNYIKGADLDAITSANVANQNDYARAAALSEIMGSPGILSQDTADQAGTAPSTFVDLQKFLADRRAIDDKYNTASKLSSAALDEFSGGAGRFSEMSGGSLDSLMNSYVGRPVNEFGSLENATPKEIQTKWIPFLQKEIDSMKKNPRAGLNPTTQYQYILDYLKSVVEPYKVSDGTTVRKEKV